MSQLETMPRDILISGTTFGYSFPVGVSLNFKGVDVGISLGVGKEPSPVLNLQIRAGREISGYVVKVVSRDCTHLETYSNWVPP